MPKTLRLCVRHFVYYRVAQAVYSVR